MLAVRALNRAFALKPKRIDTEGYWFRYLGKILSFFLIMKKIMYSMSDHCPNVAFLEEIAYSMSLNPSRVSL